MWGKDKAHLGWQSAKSFGAKITDLLGYKISKSSIYRILSEEMNLYNNGSADAMRTKPDLKLYFESYEKDQKAKASIGIEPSEIHEGAPYKFNPIWYEELRKEIDFAHHLLGFGTNIVIILASDIVIKKTNGMCSFIPSVEWARWFLRTVCDYVLRKVTTKKFTMIEHEKQNDQAL